MDRKVKFQVVVVLSATLTFLDYGRVARHSGAIRPSDPVYSLAAKGSIFRSAWRRLPALAAILIPASVLQNGSTRLE